MRYEIHDYSDDGETVLADWFAVYDNKAETIIFEGQESDCHKFADAECRKETS